MHFPTLETPARYRRHLVDSLRLDKLRHWDTELRRLAALALGNVAPLEPLYAAKTVLPTVLGDTLSPDLLKRHGACLAASEVILALGKVCRKGLPVRRVIFRKRGVYWQAFTVRVRLGGVVSRCSPRLFAS